MGEQLTTIGHYSKDAYATRNGSGLRHDPVGVAAHIIATRSCYATHRHYDRFLSFEHLDLMPQLFRCVRTAATRIDANDYSLHVVVFHQIGKVFAHILCYDLVFTTQQSASNRTVDNISISVIDGNFFTFQLLLDTRHICDADLVNIFIVVDMKKLLYLFLDLVGVKQTVYHLIFH